MIRDASGCKTEEPIPIYLVCVHDCHGDLFPSPKYGDQPTGKVVYGGCLLPYYIIVGICAAEERAAGCEAGAGTGRTEADQPPEGRGVGLAANSWTG